MRTIRQPWLSFRLSASAFLLFARLAKRLECAVSRRFLRLFASFRGHPSASSFPSFPSVNSDFFRISDFGFRVSAFAVLLFCSRPLPAQNVPVLQKTLANGISVLLVERHDEPTIAGGWVAHVGSSNERPGITGIAHLFEHMMFKGTPTIGTKDYKQDLQIIAAQERVRDDIRQEEKKMRAEYRRGEIDDILKPENKTTRYKELEKEFNGLITQQRNILVKNEFDRIYSSAGGSGMNAFTSEDMTAYFVTVPANKLELWMWMESERILHPVFREFYAERDVVFEERRMRTESTPLGKFAEEFNAMFWESSPYSWPTVGWPSDIPAISKAQADNFYGIYYSPQNITLILVGDFKPAAVEELAKKYFERIPQGKKSPPDVVTLEIKQLAEKRMYAEAEANPQVDIQWHTVPFGHRDSYPLEVLGELLSTRTGRLYKGLVLGSAVAPPPARPARTSPPPAPVACTRAWCWAPPSPLPWMLAKSPRKGLATSMP